MEKENREEFALTCGVWFTSGWNCSPYLQHIQLFLFVWSDEKEEGERRVSERATAEVD